MTREIGYLLHALPPATKHSKYFSRQGLMRYQCGVLGQTSFRLHAYQNSSLFYGFEENFQNMLPVYITQK